MWFVHTGVVSPPFPKVVNEFWLIVALGAVGSLGAVLTGATIGSNPRPRIYEWWLRVPEHSYGIAHLIFYSSISLLLLAWLSVGAQARRGDLTIGRVWMMLAFWGGPLLVGTPLFGRDVYSYVAQGELARRGYNPYLVTPQRLGNGDILASVASVWHHTTSPYGPLFVVLSRVVATLTSHSLIMEVIGIRLLMLIGVILLMRYLPLIAHHYGVDGSIALWLGVLSPLALFSAVSSAHNDTLMLGLMAMALWLQLQGKWRWAVVVFAVATTIKLPALAGVVFLVAAEWRNKTWRNCVRLSLESVAIVAAVLVGATELSGYGWWWLSAKALSIPTQLHILTSPTVSIGVLVATLLHALGANSTIRNVVASTQHVGELLAVITVTGLIVRTRPVNSTRYLGITLLIVVILSPTVWPWYFLWGITMLAVTTAQRSTFLALLSGFAMLLVGPGGTPMIGGNGFYPTSVLLLAGLIWFVASGQWRTVIGGTDRAG